jgi:hypothetical protein
MAVERTMTEEEWLASQQPDPMLEFLRGRCSVRKFRLFAVAGCRRITPLILDERAFGGLPILADAVEEAGCTDADILGHLRGPGAHYRGCWALDSLRGKA